MPRMVEANNTHNWVENGCGSHGGVVCASRGVVSGANELCHDSWVWGDRWSLLASNGSEICMNEFNV
jgi:hypothetical protein